MMNYPYQPYQMYPFQNNQQQMSQNQMPQNQMPQNQIPQQQMPQTQNYQPQFQQQIPIQNGGFAVVRSEQEARDYLLAPGTFMTFKNENSQYMYEKSRTFSQLDAPTFKKFRLVEEDDTDIEVVGEPAPQFALKEEYINLLDQVNTLQDEIKILRDMMSKKPQARAKKENTDE